MINQPINDWSTEAHLEMMGVTKITTHRSNFNTKVKLLDLDCPNQSC